MVSSIHPKHRASIDKIVTALQARPPRVRTALHELRRVFERSGDTPPAILAACSALLNHDDATSADVLAAVRTAAADWHNYDDRERDLFHRCVYTSEQRRTVALSDVDDITALLRTTPPRITDALNALRWHNAATQRQHLTLFTACAALLKNPSTDHPTVRHALSTGRDLWPTLPDDHRALFTACVYVSTARATHARRHTANHAQQTEATSGDLHRCGNCDGNLADTPELAYCSTACRTNAETHQRPHPDDDTAPNNPPAQPHTIEQQAHSPYTVGDVEAHYDHQYRQILAAIPNAGTVRKDARTVDAYEDERQRHLDRDDHDDQPSDLTGDEITDDDRERQALRGIDPAALCRACHLERTPTEQRAPHNDGRCAACRERGIPPLTTTRTLATAA